MLDTASNNEAFRKLHAALHRKDLMLFAGAGVSVDAGYPTWKRLLKTLSRETAENLRRISLENVETGETRDAPIIEKLPDLLWRAEYYRGELGEDRFREIIQSTFQPKKARRGRLATILAALPFKHVLTTNYDSTLLMAFKKAGRVAKAVDWSDRDAVRDFFARLPGKNPGTYLLHIHGRYDPRSDLVLTESDYVKRYILSQESISKLSALFMTSRVLFVGFSFSDPQFEFILRTVQAFLGSTGTKGEPTRFMLIESRKKRGENTAYEELFRQKYGIQLVFYKKSKTHRDLATTLRHLHNARWEPKPLAKPDPEDPNKGRFGGKRSQSGYSLTATVTQRDTAGDIHDVYLKVTSKRRALGQRARFYMHAPTFPKPYYTKPFEGRSAKFHFWAWGAFTVGVDILKEDTKGRDSVVTQLELDLSQIRSAPAIFRNR